MEVCRIVACILLSFLVSTGASSVETAHAEINYDITVRIDIFATISKPVGAMLYGVGGMRRAPDTSKRA